MNTTAKALIFAVVSVASAASIGMGLADRMAQPKTEIVRLETVVITGHRVHAADAQVAAARIEYLPRVVIKGRAMPAGDVRVAAAAAAQSL